MKPMKNTFTLEGYIKNEPELSEDEAICFTLANIEQFVTQSIVHEFHIHLSKYMRKCLSVTSCIGKGVRIIGHLLQTGESSHLICLAVDDITLVPEFDRESKNKSG